MSDTDPQRLPAPVAAPTPAEPEFGLASSEYDCSPSAAARGMTGGPTRIDDPRSALSRKDGHATAQSGVTSV